MEHSARHLFIQFNYYLSSATLVCCLHGDVYSVIGGAYLGKSTLCATE